MNGLTYELTRSSRLNGRHIIDVGYDYQKLLFTNYHSKEYKPKDEVIEWLDENTPGWEFFCVKVIVEFWFNSKEDAMRFKLTWA